MNDKQARDTPNDHLVEQGHQKIRWAELHQRLLQRLRGQFSETKPFAASRARLTPGTGSRKSARSARWKNRLLKGFIETLPTLDSGFASIAIFVMQAAVPMLQV